MPPAWKISALIVATMTAVVPTFLAADSYPELYGEALEAYRQNDVDAFGASVRRMLEVRPQYPMALYFNAIYYTRADRHDDALGTLASLAAMGLDFPVAEEKGLTALKQYAEFDSLVTKFQKNREPVGSAQIAITLSDTDFLLEGIARSRREKSFFLGSVRKGEIVRIRDDGTAELFVSLPDHGLWSAFGMDIDDEQGRLVVASSSVNQFVYANEDGGAAVAWFALADGRLTAKCLFPDSGTDHVLGDLRLSPGSESVFVSDSTGGGVYRVSPNDCEFTEIVAPGLFVSPQGIAFDTNGSNAYIADYRGGLFVWNADNGSLMRLAPIYGIDGLVFENDCLIAVQNGIKPHRLIRLCLTDRTTLADVDVLASALPQFDEPTQSVIVGNKVYLVANSQWNKYGDDGQPVDRSRLQPPLILSIALHGCNDDEVDP